MKENTSILGKVIVRSYPAGTVDTLRKLKRRHKWTAYRRLFSSGKVEVIQKNLVVFSLNRGYDILVQFLISAYLGSFAFPLGIAWGEIGTGSASPTNADTALAAPTNRATVSYAADLGYNEAQLQFFFPDGVLANGTYSEFGTFVGGTSTIGTGNMFNHALFASPYSKSAGTDTTVECDFSFSAPTSGFDQGTFS